MIYGIEDTTDLHAPETKVVRFTRRSEAEQWVAKHQGFAWPGAARNDIPGPSQNFHHRLRAIYDMPPGWRPPSKTEQRKWVEAGYGSSYRRAPNDFVARCIRRDGDQIYPSSAAEAREAQVEE